MKNWSFSLYPLDLRLSSTCCFDMLKEQQSLLLVVCLFLFIVWRQWLIRLAVSTANRMPFRSLINHHCTTFMIYCNQCRNVARTAWDSKNLIKLYWFIVFQISIWGVLYFCLKGLSPPSPPWRRDWISVFGFHEKQWFLATKQDLRMM